MLLEKSLANKWRVRLQFNDAASMTAMDSWLWTYKDDSFLPHGCDNQPGADAHLVLLTCEPAPATEDVVFLIGGATPGDMNGVTRCITMVDSRDEHGRSVARDRWKAAKAQSLSVSYWTQDDRGKWGKRE